MSVALLIVTGSRVFAMRRLRKRMLADGRTHGYNFTDRVRMTLATARMCANELGHNGVGTEHILLALLRAEPGVAVAVLQNLRVDLDKLRDDVLALAPRGRSTAEATDLPYTARAKHVLERSMSAARDLNHNYVGTEHMLLGLIREHDGIAARALAQAGVTDENARAQAVRLFTERPK